MMGYSCWLCGYVVFTDDGFKLMSKRSCPECRVSSAFVPLSGEGNLDEEANSAMDKLDKETRGLFTRRRFR